MLENIVFEIMKEKIMIAIDLDEIMRIMIGIRVINGIDK